MEWCPRCQKNVEVRMKAIVKRIGKTIVITEKLYHCTECGHFI